MNTKVWINVSVMIVLFVMLLGAPGYTTASALPTHQPNLQRVTAGQAIMDLSQPAAARPVVQLARGLSVFENFEKPWPDIPWDVIDVSPNDGGDYQWGRSNCHPHTGLYAMRSHGGGVDGSKLGCDAPFVPGMYTTAAIYNIDLSKAQTVVLEFYFWGKSQANPDGSCSLMGGDLLGVAVSPDGTELHQDIICGDHTNGPDGNGYTKYTIDVTSILAGKANAALGFAFVSRGTHPSTGFMVDDVTIRTTGPGVNIFLPMTRK